MDAAERARADDEWRRRYYRRSWYGYGGWYRYGRQRYGHPYGWRRISTQRGITWGSFRVAGFPR